MPDHVKDPIAGPDSMFSTTLPPSRGQWFTLAGLACQALRIKVPTNRFEATQAIVRLTNHLNSNGGE